MDSSSTTTKVAAALCRLRQGEESARAELISHAQERFRLIASRMLRNFPHVGRWEATDDVLQTALIRLHQALIEIVPNDPQHFVRLATLQIRRTLIDFSRRYQGPEGLAENHETKQIGEQAPPSHERFVDSQEPQSLEEWTHFHEAVAALPEDERCVFEMVWYQGMSQAEIGEVLGLSERTVRRRWIQARLWLAERLEP